MDNSPVNMEVESEDYMENTFAFYLKYGTIVYQPRDRSLSEEESIPEHFSIFNSTGARPIQLYRNEVMKLTRELPKAYLAFKKGDTSFCIDIVVSKSQRITLEVCSYNDKYYLFLKKSFKPADKVNDPNQDWIYTRSNVSFIPDEDDVNQLLRFVLNCKS